MRLRERGAVARDHRRRNDFVALGFDHQHVSAKARAGAQCAILGGRNEAATVGDEVLLAMQLQLRQFPAGVAIQRGHAQPQPAHLAHFGENRRQVAAVAAADDGDRFGIDLRVRGEDLVSAQHVAQVPFARDGFALCLRARVPAQVERQAHAAQRRDVARAREILLLRRTPSVHEENARQPLGRHDQRAVDPVGADDDVDVALTRLHRRAGARTW